MVIFESLAVCAADDQRVQMCVRAMEAARQPAEKKLVVEILKRYPNMDTLKLAIKVSIHLTSKQKRRKPSW